VTEIAARSGSNVEPRIREARSDDGCDVGPHARVSVNVDPEVADRRNWLHVSGTNADRTRRDLMLSTRRCAPENFSLGVIQLQLIGCHPSRNLIDTDGHFLCRSECRSRRHDESVGGASPTVAGQRCTDSVYLTCSKKLTGSQLSLPHGTNRKLKCETKNKMMSVIGPVKAHYHEGSPVGKISPRWEGFVEKVGFEP